VIRGELAASPRTQSAAWRIVIGRFRDRSFLGAALTRGSALRLRMPRKLITGPYASFAASAQARLSSCMIKCTPIGCALVRPRRFFYGRT
jgi:hypothetical protein